MLLTPFRNVFETFNISLKRFWKFLTCCQNLFGRYWHLVEGGADEGVVRGAAEAEAGGRVGGVQVPVVKYFTMIWFFRSFPIFRLFTAFELNSSGHELFQNLMMLMTSTYRIKKEQEDKEKKKAKLAEMKPKIWGWETISQNMIFSQDSIKRESQSCR